MGKDSHYKRVYCNIQRGEHLTRGDVNEEVVKVVAKQFELNEDMIGQILNGTICQGLSQKTDAEIKTMPVKVVQACLPQQAGSIGVQLDAQNLFLEVQNSYQKEKMLFFNKTALKMKFQASEQYWDNRVGGPLDAPFDLMVDLNLIDVVLFGSKAKWNGDVYNFPQDEDETASDPQIPQADITTPQNLDLETEEAEGETQECVPIGDPEADPNAQPLTLLCGNGTLDILQAEKCDDGNQISGDGCSQYCQIEGTGATNMCQDPDVVTFKSPESDSQAMQQGENSLDITSCPPGMVPKKASKASDVLQSANYPGPEIGGTLKQFPTSERPICSPGSTTALEITVAGQKQIARDGNGDPICLPTEICSDPDVVRSFLAATSFPFPIQGIAAAQWKELPEDDPVRQALEAIEVISCVNIIKENRPTSYYNPNEGCIDCHVRAMADAAEKALSTNVTPLVNPTKAFGLSSRFGPNMSFNLTTLIKPKLKLTETRTADQAIKKGNQAINQAQTEATNPGTSLPDPRPDATKLEELSEIDLETQQALNDSLKAYNLAGDSIADMELNTRLGPLLEQMRSNFSDLQSQYQGMVDSTYFDDKKTCS